MKSKPRSIAGRAVAVGVLVFACVVVGLAAPASANGSRQGHVIPTNPNTLAPVLSGGSSTAWTLTFAPSSGIRCSGDTASQGFHVYSFIVPLSVDPGTLTFNPSTGPSTGFPLVDNSGTAYIAANTAANTGQVINIPTFNFNLFATTSMGGTKLVLAPGDYLAGIACANTAGQGDKYWSTQFTFTANGGDPNGEVWTDKPDKLVTGGGCKSNVTAGAQLGQYPAYPGMQSYLRVGCILQHSTGGVGDMVSSNFTIHDFANVQWHDGAARTVTNSLAFGPNATSVTFVAPVNDPGCATMAGFVNRPISRVGTGAGNLKPYTTVKNMAGCVATLNRQTGVGIIPANTSFKIENSSDRAVDDGAVQAGSPMITSTEANFQASDTGCSVSGTNWQDGATLNAPISATTADTTPGPISYALNSLPAASQVVTICGNRLTATQRRTLDTAATSTATTIKSGKVKWSNDDIGMPISGPGIASPCYIASFTAPPGNTATLSAACGSVGITDFTIGDPTYTAPANGDAVLQLANESPLDPGLVKGSHDCSEDQPAGFGIEGTWMNPGSFVPPDGIFLNAQPANTKAIGQILFTTSVVSFAAYVVEASPGQDATSSGALHYNVEFPGAPVTLALCASTATSPGLGLSIGINGVTASQGALTTGVGRPDTAQLRATNPSTTGSTSTVFFTDDLTNSTTTTGGGVKWLNSDPNFNRLCGPIAAGKADISPPNGFTCGSG